MSYSKLPNYPTIHLNPEQVASGVYTANLREAESKRLSHSNVRGLSESDGTNYSLNGALGEVAFSVAAHLPYYHSVNEWSSPDFVTAKNVEIDVKTSTQGHTLYISPRHLHENRLFTLVIKTSETDYQMAGFIPGTKVSGYPLKDIGLRGSPVYCVPASALKQFKFPKA